MMMWVCTQLCVWHQSVSPSQSQCNMGCKSVSLSQSQHKTGCAGTHPYLPWKSVLSRTSCEQCIASVRKRKGVCMAVRHFYGCLWWLWGLTFIKESKVLKSQFVFLFVLLKSLCISQEAVFIFVFCFVFHCWENVSLLLCCSILVLAKGACIGKHLFWIPIMKANFFALTFFSLLSLWGTESDFCVVSSFLWYGVRQIRGNILYFSCIFDFNICFCRTWLYAVGCTCFSLCISGHDCMLLGTPVSACVSLYMTVCC